MIADLILLTTTINNMKERNEKREIIVLGRILASSAFTATVKKGNDQKADYEIKVFFCN
jgi:hypothetical protein